MPQIIDQFGRPIDRAVLAEPQTARIATLANTYLTPALNGLTPARLASALAAADQGDLIAQHRIFSDMEERDAHIVSEMNKRKLALVDLDWDIVPPRNATAAEKKHAEWVQEVLEDAVDPLEDLILALADGIGHGFAPVELEWRREGVEWLPAFHPRPQEWFRLDATRTSIRLQDASAEGAPLAAFGWVWHAHGKAKTGYMGRMGIHRTLCWPFLYKAYAVGDFAEFLETYGLPIILGKYFAGAGPDEKASLLRAVTALGHDARAIMPSDMQLEVQKVTGEGSGTPHLAMVDWAERSESKAILGQTTSAEAKATGLGSGIAQAHAEVRDDIRNADARQIAATITRDLVYPLIALNRGGVDGLRRSPRLVFDTGEAEDMAAYAEALPKLIGVGFRVPRPWAQEKLRIPEPQDNEDVLGVVKPAGGAGADSPSPPAPPPKLDNQAAAALSGAGSVVTSVTLSAPDGHWPPSPSDAIAEQLAQAGDRPWGEVLDTVRRVVEQAESLEALQADLVAAYGGLPTARLTAIMTLALASAELAGMVAVVDESHDGQ